MNRLYREINHLSLFLFSPKKIQSLHAYPYMNWSVHQYFSPLWKLGKVRCAFIYLLELETTLQVSYRPKQRRF